MFFVRFSFVVEEVDVENCIDVIRDASQNPDEYSPGPLHPHLLPIPWRITILGVKISRKDRDIF